uniref:Pre-mRNA splicing Prp18-interacting factor n=1 Tax=Tanacetum cinerariifolium TaxID=118510 RepID=A0A6L2MPG8_TANCI|nr:hypothetical protein [Tanacetum cinerariifolium]
MASFDYRLNPLYPIKACSSCGALYTTNYCCSEGILRDKIIYDLDQTPDLSQRSPQNCPKCGKPVDGHYCQGCALLRKKFKEDQFASCVENGIFQDSFEPSNDNTNVVNAPRDPFVVNQDLGKNSSQSPPQINHHCCYECGDPLEDIFFHQCTCELCGRGAHYGYNCPPKVPVVPDQEPFNNQTIDELPQTLPSFDPTFYSKDGNSFTYDSTSNLFPIIHQPVREKTCAELLAEEQEANIDTQPFQYSIIPQPPQEEMSVEFLREKRNQLDFVKTFLRKFNRISFYELPKSSSTSLNSLLEETNTFDNSLPELETFYFDLEEIISGSTTTRFDISLPEYEAFYDDHVKEISSGSTTTHSDSSLYDLFIFDLLINPFPPADRSDFYEFADELTHVISPPEYDCFFFKNGPNSGDFTMDVVEDIFPTREPSVYNALPTHPTL